MYYTYLLKLSNSKIYTGSTPDLKRRITEHDTGKCEATKNFRPLKLIWYCAFENRLQARRFESYLKTGSGQAFRNRHLVKRKLQRLRDATLVFLIRKPQDKVLEICLAMKKRGFGINRWNGVGGKVEKNENIESAAKRETAEEIGVEIRQIYKVAELSFYFPHNSVWDQKVHVYFSEVWVGEPRESEEMKPKWFKTENIPYGEMWPDDEYWVPEVLSGGKIKASFIFGKGDVVESKEVNVVDGL